jgi:hypothetical protein
MNAPGIVVLRHPRVVAELQARGNRVSAEKQRNREAEKKRRKDGNDGQEITEAFQ